jgi:hypothetical protein
MSVGETPATRTQPETIASFSLDALVPTPKIKNVSEETGVREILFRWSYVDPTGETGETHGGQTGIMENNMSLAPVFRTEINLCLAWTMLQWKETNLANRGQRHISGTQRLELPRLSLWPG